MRMRSAPPACQCTRRDCSARQLVVPSARRGGRRAQRAGTGRGASAARPHTNRCHLVSIAARAAGVRQRRRGALPATAELLLAIHDKAQAARIETALARARRI